MCIRDRRARVQGLARQQREAILDELPVLGEGGPLEDAITACLLYTSDAADERSSVDLGGRRIIKKKKTK